jgi:YD repeat-containing protein
MSIPSKLAIFIAVSFFSISYGLCQTFDPEASNYNAIGTPNFGGDLTNPDVNEANGLISVNIPLFDFGNADLTDKVLISYNASGIKVNETASRVGLGWNLVAGGRITRVVCGLPDDEPEKGILTPGIFNIYSQFAISDGWLSNIYKGWYDSEFDYYIIQAGSLNVKFFFDGSQFYCMPSSGIKIERGTFDNIANSFKVTDLSGNMYFFTLQDKFSMQNGLTGPLVPFERTHSWLLTKVLSPNQSAITYHYKNPISYVVNFGKNEAAIHVKEPNFLDGDVPGIVDVRVYNDYSNPTIFHHSKVHQIERIEWDLGQLFFEYANTPRADLPGDFNLVSIYQKNTRGIETKRFNFNQQHGNRMMLLGLQEVRNGSATLPAYQFGYNPNNLPPIGSFSQDRFGYFNNENALRQGEPTMLPKITYHAPVRHSAGNYTVTIPGAERNPSVGFLQSMILTRIIFPSGLIRQIEYEGNTYMPSGASTEVAGPGVRVKKVIDDDGNGNKKIKKYTYFNGVFFNHTRVMQFEITKNVYSFAWVNNIKRDTTAPQKLIYRMSNQSSAFPSLFPANVIYGKVVSEEIDEAGNNLSGLTENEYYAAPLTFHVEPARYNQPARNTAILTTPHFFYGVLLKSTVKAKTSEGYRIVKEKSFEYNFSESPLKLAFGVYARPLNPYGTNAQMYNVYSATNGYAGGTYVGIHKYWYFSQPFYVSKITDKEWGTTGSLFNQTISAFYYETADRKHFAPIKIVKTFSDGTTHTRYLKRVKDYNGTGSANSQLMAIEQMKNNNQFGDVIESYLIKNEATANPVLLEANLKEFKKFSTSSALVVLDKEFQLKNINLSSFVPSSATSGLFNKSQFYFKVSEIINRNTDGSRRTAEIKGKLTCELLSKNKEFSIASFKNANANEVDYIGFESHEYEIENGINNQNKLHFNNFSFTYNSANPPIITGGFAGGKSIQLGSNNRLEGANSLNLIQGKKYQITLWVRNGNVQLTNNGTVVNQEILQTSGLWSLISFTFIASIGKPEITGTGIIDEFKLAPFESEITTQSYDDLGRVSAESDTNNNYVFYEYDNYGRLWRTRDIEGNLLKQNSFHFQQIQN